MFSVYHEIVSSQSDNIFYLLAKLGKDVIFDDLTAAYEGDELLKKAVKFIVYCYSIDSDRISLGSDRRKEKAAIFKMLDIDPALYDDFVLLGEKAVVESAQKWLRDQDSVQFEFLTTLREAYVQQQAAALKPLEKASGGTDWDQKQKCIEHMASLKKMIKDAEAELKQNDPKLKEAHEEVQKASKKISTIGPENFAY